MFGKREIPFLRFRHMAFTLSASLLAIGLFFYFVNSGLRWGIDLAGGIKMEVQFAQEVSADEVRDAVREAGVGQAVQRVGAPSEHKFFINAKSEEGQRTEEKVKIIRAALTERFGENIEVRGQDTVEPKVGREIRKNAMWAVAAALALILLYITIRFDFRYSIGAIAALLHDVVLALGFIAAARITVDTGTIAVLLTIVGYSINDTIVIFDRIRENDVLKTRSSFTAVIDLSINQSLKRTLFTSFTTLLVVMCLIVLGGPGLRNFALTLLFGIIVGTYSSVFIASPVLLLWRRKTT